jgi:hypothetical protein
MKMVIYNGLMVILQDERINKKDFRQFLDFQKKLQSEKLNTIALDLLKIVMANIPTNSLIRMVDGKCCQMILELTI